MRFNVWSRKSYELSYVSCEVNQFLASCGKIHIGGKLDSFELVLQQFLIASLV